MEHEFLHQPTASNGTGLVLTHGAGGNCRAPLLVRVAETLADAGITVMRCDLAFRVRGSAGPPTPATSATDRAGLEAAVVRMRDMVPGAVYLGGHSYGGRQSSMLAAEEPGLVDALLLLSYPLHPPNKPQQLRTAHFPDLHTRAIFLHGTKDPFGTPDEIESAIKLIPGPTTLIKIEGAGHDLKKGRFDMTDLARLLMNSR